MQILANGMPKAIDAMISYPTQPAVAWKIWLTCLHFGSQSDDRSGFTIANDRQKLIDKI